MKKLTLVELNVFLNESKESVMFCNGMQRLKD